MTLAERLLPRLSEWSPSGEGRHSFSAALPEAGWNVQISADKVDTLSCLLWELTLNRSGGSPDFSIKEWANSVADRVGGLLEEIKLHEVDSGRNEAILRSVAPTRKGDQVAYYEVRLVGINSASVRRFSAAKAVTGREQIAFALTHESLAKLAGDIAG